MLPTDFLLIVSGTAQTVDEVFFTPCSHVAVVASSDSLRIVFDEQRVFLPVGL